MVLYLAIARYEFELDLIPHSPCHFSKRALGHILASKQAAIDGGTINTKRNRYLLLRDFAFLFGVRESFLKSAFDIAKKACHLPLFGINL
jgi:hypothetical protein